MKKYLFVFCYICILSLFSSLAATESNPEKIEEEKTRIEELTKALDDADSVVIASIKNVVNGKIRNYAVLEVSEELKGIHGRKVLYVGFDPSIHSDFFQIDKKGLWMLKNDEGAPYTTLIKGRFFEENYDENKIKEILAGQNSLSPEDIEFTIKTDKNKYCIDEAIRVEMTIRNKGTKSITYDDSILWGFTHSYSLIVEKEGKTELLKIEKPAGGIVGEFPGPRFVRLSSGEIRNHSFNLIRLLTAYPPSGLNILPQMPKCNATLAIYWNTKNLKEYFPDIKTSYAVEGAWAAPEIKFEVTSKEAEYPEGVIKEMEKKSGIANLLECMASNEEKTFKQAEDAFVEYAVPAVEQDLMLMLVSDNPILREAAGRSFLWLAKHPKFMASDALLEYLAKSDEITDTGAWNQVLSFITSVAIKQNRKEYVPQFVSALESENTTIIVTKEVVTALSTITGLELSEENFDETIEKMKKWIENPEGAKAEVKKEEEKKPKEEKN